MLNSQTHEGRDFERAFTVVAAGSLGQSAAGRFSQPALHDAAVAHLDRDGGLEPGRFRV